MRNWLIAALAAPAAAYSCGSGWGGVAAATAAGMAAYLLLEKLWEPAEKPPSWLAVIQWLWLGIYTGRMAGYVGTLWPEGRNGYAVPLILIGLACIGAAKRTGCGGEIASLLVWLILPAIAGVFLAGKNNIKWEWVAEVETKWKPELFSLMLLPAMTVTLMREEGKKKGAVPILVAGAAGLASVLVVNGSLTQKRAAELVNPLYEYSKSVTLLGTVKGLEAVIACTMTAGWYALLSLLIGSAAGGIHKMKPKWTKTAVWTCGAIGASVVLLDIANPAAEALASGVIWVGMPAVEGLRNKLKKQKNST